MIDFLDIDTEEVRLTDNEFVKFLIENEAYDGFIFNLQKEILHGVTSLYYDICWFDINTFCHDIETMSGRKTYVNHSFYWDDAIEGVEFWKKIHFLWVDKV